MGGGGVKDSQSAEKNPVFVLVQCLYVTRLLPVHPHQIDVHNGIILPKADSMIFTFYCEILTYLKKNTAMESNHLPNPFQACCCLFHGRICSDFFIQYVERIYYELLPLCSHTYHIITRFVSLSFRRTIFT